LKFRLDEIALQLLTRISAEVNSPRDGERTRQLSRVLEGVAASLEDTENPGLALYGKFSNGEWMGIDFWWWFRNDNEERGLLAAESQWWNPRWDDKRNEAEILEDFWKLPSLKSDVKLMVFSAPDNCGQSLIEKFRQYLSRFSQHTKNERYLVVWLSSDGQHRSFLQSKILDTGKVTALAFDTLTLYR
jgi:hypothetical protein